MVFMSIAFSLVASIINNQSLQDTLPYVTGGVMAFTLVGIVLNESPEVYIANSGIISNHAYPFTYYSFESVTKAMMIFAHNVVVFEIVLALVHRLAFPHWSIIAAIPLVYINLFTWGSLVSMASARFRDLRFLLPYLTTIFLFMTPIMYPADKFVGNKRLLLDFNPLYPFVEMLRSPLMGIPMALHYWYIAFGITLAGMLLWLVFFNSMRNRISFWV